MVTAVDKLNVVHNQIFISKQNMIKDFATRVVHIVMMVNKTNKHLYQFILCDLDPLCIDLVQSKEHFLSSYFEIPQTKAKIQPRQAK